MKSIGTFEGLAGATAAVLLTAGCTAPEAPVEPEVYSGWTVQYDVQPGSQRGADLRALVTNPDSASIEICAYETDGTEEPLSCSKLDLITGEESETVNTLGITVGQLMFNRKSGAKVVVVTVENEGNKTVEVDLRSNTSGVVLTAATNGRFVDTA